MDVQERHFGRQRLFDIIQLGTHYDLPSQLFDYVLVAMIITNLSILILETFDEVVLRFGTLMDRIEWITVAFFTVEYILRLCTAIYLFPGETSHNRAALRFAVSFYGIIDLLTLLPYYLPLVLPMGFVTFRVLRVIRVFRLFRVNSQSDAFNVVTEVLTSKRKQLLSSISLILIMMLAASILMYSLEHEAQPEVFKNAFSGIWWSVSTLLTIGYGDIYPITIAGKCTSIVIACLGVGLVAIPTGIISAGFVEQFQNMRNFSEASVGNDLSFVMLTLEDDHPWTNKTISQIVLPPELIIVTIIRNGHIVTPRGPVRMQINDKVVLGALTFKDDIGIYFREFAITATHPWRDRLIRDITFEKDEVLVSVVRHEEALIPRGDMQLRLGDFITICDLKA